MNNHRNHPLVRLARRRVIGVGMVTGAVVTAGMIAAATARADTGSGELGDAASDLTQATQALDGAPTASLDAQEAAFLSGQEALQTGPASDLIADQESLEAGFPAAEQSDLTGVDTQLADAYQAILNADQTFVAADQAGDLTGLTGLTDEVDVIGADFGVLPADFNVTAADIGAEVTNLFGLTDFLSF